MTLTEPMEAKRAGQQRMAKLDKLLARLLEGGSDTGFAFADICYLLRRLDSASRSELAVATMSSEERGSESTSR